METYDGVIRTIERCKLNTRYSLGTLTTLGYSEHISPKVRGLLRLQFQGSGHRTLSEEYLHLPWCSVAKGSVKACGPNRIHSVKLCKP